MDIIGIDIGTVKIKYVRIQRKSGKVNIISKNHFDYKGTKEDLENIIDIMAVNEGTNHEVLISTTSQDIYKKSFTIPFMPKDEIKEPVIWSASKLISVPIEDTYYEFDIIGDVDERGIKKKDIFLACMEKSRVDDMIALFKEKGFKKITLFTDTSFVYAPYVKDLSPELSLIIDIGGRITGIYIVENGKNIFFREILTASESFTDALMGGFGYSYEQAEQYKNEKGIIEDSASIMNVTLERLVGEIQRTLSVFNQKYPYKSLRRIYLTGGGSRIPNLMERLRGFFAEEIVHLDTFDGIEEVFLPAYLLCVKKSMLFNLLPPGIKAQEKEEGIKKWIRIGTLAVISVLILVSITLLGRIKRLDSNIEMSKILIDKKRQQFTQLSRVASPSIYSELFPIWNDIKKRDITYITLLKFLSSRLPEDVYLKGVYLELSDKKTTPQKADTQKEGQVKAKPQSPQPPQKTEKIDTTSGVYYIRLKGYIFGEKNLLEPALLKLMIKLEESGFIYNVDVADKEIKTLKGTGIMEFEIRGRCAFHEV